jgi:hypothetical protein
MFGWLKRPAKEPKSEEPKVNVFLNPLAVLLAMDERKKGSPLTEEDVLQVRDRAASVVMTASQAQKFYAALDAKIPTVRLNPDNLCAEWQAIRDQVQW